MSLLIESAKCIRNQFRYYTELKLWKNRPSYYSLELKLKVSPLQAMKARTSVALALSIGLCSCLGDRQLVEIKAQ